MKLFLLLILFFSSFLYSCPTIAQDKIDKNHYLDNTTRDLSSVAKWLKNSGNGNSDQFYEYFMANRTNLHHIRASPSMENITYYWHFYDSGLLEIERADNSKKMFRGEWGAVNSDQIKFNAQSLERPNEILYYESQTDHLFTQEQNEQVPVSKTPTRTPVPANKSQSTKVNQKTSYTIAEEMARVDPKTKTGNLRDWRYFPSKCIYCYGSGIVKECKHCEKRGYRYCWDCGGKQYNRNGSVCINCAGKGVVTCSDCKGKIYNFKCLHWVMTSFH